MAVGRMVSILRILKPLAAGLAVAYLVTAFVDRPAPVHFQPENPYASKQAEIVEPQAEMVMEKNAMKLGSPLSVQPDAVIETESVAKIEESRGQSVVTGNATDSTSDNVTSSVKGEVEGVMEP